jgi:hypothetical protein
MATETGNPRFLLRAYESADPVRLAVLLTSVPPEARPVARDTLATEWAQRWPRHAAQTGNSNIRSRIRHGLSMLSAVGIVSVDSSGNVGVVDEKLLAMAAANEAIIFNDAGESRPPSEWPARPVAPEVLRAVQEEVSNRPPYPLWRRLQQD